MQQSACRIGRENCAVVAQKRERKQQLFQRSQLARTARQQRRALWIEDNKIGLVPGSETADRAFQAHAARAPPSVAR